MIERCALLSRHSRMPRNRSNYARRFGQNSAFLYALTASSTVMTLRQTTYVAGAYSDGLKDVRSLTPIIGSRLTNAVAGFARQRIAKHGCFNEHHHLRIARRRQGGSLIRDRWLGSCRPEGNQRNQRGGGINRGYA